MNRERAETHLRFVAEAELRRATAPRRDGAAMPPALPGAERDAVVPRRSAVAAALYDLPIRQREVIALRYYGNLSEAETATVMRITRGAVHAFTAHGMSALRAALETGTSSRVARVAQAAHVATGPDPYARLTVVTLMGADVSEFRHRILMQRPASPFVISNAVRATWLGAGTQPSGARSNRRGWRSVRLRWQIRADRHVLCPFLPRIVRCVRPLPDIR